MHLLTFQHKGYKTYLNLFYRIHCHCGCHSIQWLNFRDFGLLCFLTLSTFHKYFPLPLSKIDRALTMFEAVQKRRCTHNDVCNQEVLSLGREADTHYGLYLIQ